MPQDTSQKLPMVDIGIACNKNQVPEFWKSLLALEWAGGAFMTAGGALTDVNRNRIATWFLLERKKIEWLLFIDDDIEIPPDALSRLLSHGKKGIIAAVYYRRKPPCDPLIYRRMDDGWYTALLPDTDYKPGDLVPIDACGMGCTLVHRSAFEAIIESHFLYRRHNKSYGFMHYDQVYQEEASSDLRSGLHISEDGIARVISKVKPMLIEHMGPGENLPFFVLEYGRTEDYAFCEMAKAAGVEIWADTSIECNHWGSAPINQIGRASCRERG